MAMAFVHLLLNDERRSVGVLRKSGPGLHISGSLSAGIPTYSFILRCTNALCEFLVPTFSQKIPYVTPKPQLAATPLTAMLRRFLGGDPVYPYLSIKK
jgi:hypothetical protein